MERQTIIYDGFKFHRYPNAKKSSDRNYYKGWVKQGGVWRKSNLHIHKYTKEVGIIPKGYSVHHIDGDFNNNEASNYAIMFRGKHLSHHYKMSSQEQKDAGTKRLLELAIPEAVKWHKSEAGKQWHKQNTDKLIYTKEYTTKCIDCGTKFKSNLRRKPKHCSRKCQLKYQARRDRAAKKYHEDRVCQRCGKVFSVNKWSKAKFCSCECTKGKQIR